MTGTPVPETGAPPRGRWVKPLLVVSLAINLAVAALVVGAVIRGGPPMRGAMHQDGGRDLGIGLMVDSLSRADRAALRRAFVASDPGLGNWRERARQEFAVLLAALRAEPFDPEALRAVMQEQSARMRTRLENGREILIDRIAAMTPAERAEFAARIEERLERLPGARRRD